MSQWTRREIIQGGLAASAAALAVDTGNAAVLVRGPETEAPSAAPRERLLLDPGWRFHLGHADDPALDFDFGKDDLFAKSGVFFAPSALDFDASAWRGVDLPHDWAVDLPFIEDPDQIAHGAKPLGRRYPATSIGWYRRVFELPAADLGRRISLEFDGVFRDSIVALNGHFLGRNQSGYAPFRYDVTDLVNCGGKNVLVVRADATEHEGWFYEGAGIYRHVWLVKTDPIHVPQWGTFVSSEVRSGNATLTVRTTVVNESALDRPCRVTSTVIDPAGKRVGMASTLPLPITAVDRREYVQQISVLHPELWSVDTPALYRLVTIVSSEGRETDRYETPFGIRTTRFDADRGFFLNGARIELQGMCNHQDHAGVGAALPDRLQAYRIERLKAMGCNAYRTSHNPPTPELLEACDRLGMLVFDETRMFSSEPEGLGQLERMMQRDRNHPSVFCWSIANEEWAVEGNERGTRIGSTLRDFAHRIDPTRPVTAAMDGGWGKGISLAVDVQGCNYNQTKIDGFHRDFPRRPMMGSEVASAYATRGIYAADKARGYVSAYDVNRPSYGDTAEEWWAFFATRPFLAGGFVWTGFDYRGEPSPYAWPCISSHFGVMDTCGFPKDTFYYYQAWWGKAPVLHLFPHWNWAGREGEEIEVWSHSNLDRVELFLNGASQGVREIPKNGHAMWKVPYTAGTIEARGYRGSEVVLTDRRETTGAPAAVQLRADRTTLSADGEDVAVLTVEIVDAAGRVVPTADNEVTFSVSDAGTVIGVGNGDPSSHESDRGPARRAFNGLCCAIVQASRVSGEIRIDASAEGLAPGRVTLTGAAAALRPYLPAAS